MKQRVKDKFKSGIYVIQNNVNQKKYVGKAIDIYKRIKSHVTFLNTKNKNENYHLINSWHKYGRENFSYYVIEYIYDENQDILEQKLSEQELYWIKTLNTIDRKNGYNLRLDSSGKCIVSDETRERCKQSQKERYKNLEQRKICSEKSIQAHINHKESFENAKEKLAYSNRKYRIAQCDKNTGNIIKIYEIIADISKDYPNFYLQAIKGCCQGTKNSYKEFRWHYCDLEKKELILKGKFANNFMIQSEQ